jgi:hypothetical protein
MVYAATVSKPFGLSVWDVIPGAPGRAPTHDEIVDAVARSDLNHAVLKDELGDRVIPVFHQFESAERLEEVQTINPSYICVSPQNGIPETLRCRWARDVHARLKTDMWTHGLATTGSTMMDSVAWRSVDSTTWVIHAKNGKVMIEREGQLKTYAVDDDRVVKSHRRGLRRARHHPRHAARSRHLSLFVQRPCDDRMVEATACARSARLKSRPTYGRHAVRVA